MPNLTTTTGGALVPLSDMPVFDWDGGKITKPGVYRNVPMEFYHGDACDAPSISSSGIRTIEDPEGSEMHYYDDSYLNPDREEDEDKPIHFNVGRALHHLAGGEADFRKLFVVRPEQWKDWRTGDSKKWRAEQELAGRTVLTLDHLEDLKRMARRLAEHPTIEAGILQGLVEHSIFWKRTFIIDGEPVTIWFKSRPDVLPVHSNMIVDLKTCASAAPRAVRRSITDFGYYIQLAMAYEGIRTVWKRKLTDFTLVFIESKRPHAMNIKPIGAISIEYGRRQLERGGERFARAVHTGYWPGYADDEVEAEIDDWRMKQLAKQAEDHELPPANEEQFADTDPADAF